MPEKETAQKFLRDLAEYGFFVADVGEVEAWLSHFEVTRNKIDFIREVFEKMGSDPNSDVYVNPADGDVWNFIGKTKSWFMNSDRKGMEH